MKYLIYTLFSTSMILSSINLAFFSKTELSTSKDDKEDRIQGQFAKHYGGGGIDELYETIATPDGGYLLCGHTNFAGFDVGEVNGGVYPDFWVVKIDINGEIQWERSYGGDREEKLYSAIPTSDGGYLLGGSTVSYSDNPADIVEKDFYAVKINAVGDTIWTKAYRDGITSFTSFDRISSITEISNGGYLLAGTTNAPSETRVVKIYADGSEQWDVTYGGPAFDEANSVIETSDGGFLVGGRAQISGGNVSNTIGGYDYWLYKMNANGGITWDMVYGGSGFDVIKKVIPTNDGNYLLAGYTESDDVNVIENYGLSDFWVVKVNPVGDPLWTKNYGGSDEDELFEAIQVSDGGYLFGGSSKSTDFQVSANYGEEDYYVIKVDASGNFMWEQNYGGSGVDILTSIVENPDGTFLLGGYSESDDVDVDGNYAFSDYWVVRVNSEGLIISSNLQTDFSYVSDCAGLVIEFTNETTGDAIAYTWDFGDGNTSTTVSPNHIYSQAGTYTVTLTALDSNGQSCITEYQVEVQDCSQTIVPSFTYELGCAGGETVFTNTSTGDIVFYEWDFGDGNTSNDTSPTHIYLQAGTYTVTLTAFDADGTPYTYTDILSVEENTLYLTQLIPGQSFYEIYNDATIHHYFVVTDVNDNPVEGVVVQYIDLNIAAQIVQISLPSDSDGLVDLNIKPFGDLTLDTSDDWVNSTSTMVIDIIGITSPTLCLSGETPDYTLVDFTPFSINYKSFETLEYEYGLIGERQVGTSLCAACIGFELNPVLEGNLSVIDVGGKRKKGTLFSFRDIYNEVTEEVGGVYITQVSHSGHSSNFGAFNFGVGDVTPLSIFSINNQSAFEGENDVKYKKVLGKEVDIEDEDVQISFLKEMFESISDNVTFVSSPKDHINLSIINEHFRYYPTIPVEPEKVGNSVCQSNKASGELQLGLNIIGMPFNFNIIPPTDDILTFKTSSCEDENSKTRELNVSAKPGIITEDLFGADIFEDYFSIYNSDYVNLNDELGLNLKSQLDENGILQSAYIEFLTGGQINTNNSNTNLPRSLYKEYSKKVTASNHLINAVSDNSEIFNYLKGVQTNSPLAITSYLDTEIDEAASVLNFLGNLYGTGTLGIPDDNVLTTTVQKTYSLHSPLSDYNFQIGASIGIGGSFNLARSVSSYINFTHPLRVEKYVPTTGENIIIIEYPDYDDFDILNETNPLETILSNALNIYLDRLNDIFDLGQQFVSDLVESSTAVATDVAIEFATDAIRDYFYDYIMYSEDYSLNASSIEINIPPSPSGLLLSTGSSNQKNASTSAINEITFSEYYPKGQIKGVSTTGDTILFVSDIVFLEAVDDNDSIVTEITNGDFDIRATISADDLALLGIDVNTPVFLYHREYEGMAWTNLGAANGSTINHNEFGNYSIGVVITTDVMPPQIEVVDLDNPTDDTIRLNIVDDISGVYWKKMQLVNVDMEIPISKLPKSDTVKVAISDLVDINQYAAVYIEDHAGNFSFRIIELPGGYLADCGDSPTITQPCDDGDPCTINDEETILEEDGTVCLACAGMLNPSSCEEDCTTTQPCDDGNPNTENDVEVYASDGTLCMPCVGEEVANTCITSAGISYTCNDNGTDNTAADDTFSFTLNPEGDNIGITYSISGDIVQAGIPYGSESMTFGPFPASAELSIVITDDNDPDCTLSSTIEDGCFSDIVPTVSEWGLIILALILLNLGVLYIRQTEIRIEQA